ncbi:MAG: hypothetical protein EX267_05260 [Acidimicrobiia bacterium]|nr:MAG: hypothetical protein EX267_05260 [Acidimicrobiia bacterium]
MIKRVRLVAVVGLLALVFAACGSDETTNELPGDAGAGGDGSGLVADLPVDSSGGGDGDVAGTCLAGEPVCEDTFPDSGEPPVPPPPGLAITSVVDTPIDGGFVISGFYFDDGTGARLCEALAESFPPQCGGASIPFDNTAGADLGVLSIEQGVTWSDQPVLVEGEVIDGVFVAVG